MALVRAVLAAWQAEHESIVAELEEAMTQPSKAGRGRKQVFVEGCADCERERVRKTFTMCLERGRLVDFELSKRFQPHDKVRVTVELLARTRKG